MDKLLTVEDIEAADDRKWEDVPVPEWHGTVRILGMSGTARNAYQKSILVIGDGGKSRTIDLADQYAKLLSHCLVNENFRRLYNDATVKKLGAKNGEVLERLADIAKRLSGLDEKALKDAEGKSGTTPTSASTSG
ncbi:hypothetical protein [Streptomyces odonnellii]|uniref:hypothetical protein n=1 Tax=Streptomyces odonnellii TaxID=1417980 RepID=UPI000626E40C|nr:hypothetical protein [Streptomyces odonnellii]